MRHAILGLAIGLLGGGAWAAQSGGAETQTPAMTAPAITRAPPRQSVEPPRVVTAPRVVRQPPPKELCPLPIPSKGAAVAVLGFYEGEAVSSVALGPQDEETTVIDVAVDAGRPLYLIASGYGHVVLDVSGARDRIERLGLLPWTNGALGVRGVPRERVTFADQRACDLPYGLYDGPRGLIQPRVRDLLGTPATMIGGGYSFMSARIGDTQFSVSKAPSHYRHGEPLADELMRAYEGGVRKLAPSMIVASAPAEPYRVLPGGAGLVQLLNAGKLAVGSHADIDRWIETAAARGDSSVTSLLELRRRLRSDKVFVVRGATDFPAGLCGAHSVSFIVPAGVPMPAGNPCHSTVLRADGASSR